MHEWKLVKNLIYLGSCVIALTSPKKLYNPPNKNIIILSYKLSIFKVKIMFPWLPSVVFGLAVRQIEYVYDTGQPTGAP